MVFRRKSRLIPTQQKSGRLLGHSSCFYHTQKPCSRSLSCGGAVLKNSEHVIEDIAMALLTHRTDNISWLLLGVGEPLVRTDHNAPRDLWQTASP